MIKSVSTLAGNGSAQNGTPSRFKIYSRLHKIIITNNTLIDNNSFSEKSIVPRAFFSRIRNLGSQSSMSIKIKTSKFNYLIIPHANGHDSNKLYRKRITLKIMTLLSAKMYLHWTSLFANRTLQARRFGKNNQYRLRNSIFYKPTRKTILPRRYRPIIVNFITLTDFTAVRKLTNVYVHERF